MTIRFVLKLAAVLAMLPGMASAQGHPFPVVNSDGPGSGFEKVPNFDILGIQPGDTRADAAKKLTEFYKEPVEETRLRGNVANNAGGQVALDFVQSLSRKSDPRNRGGLALTLTHRGREADFTTVYLASRVYDDRVIGIRRFISFGPEQTISAAAMRAQVEEKYGKPTAVRGSQGSVNGLVYAFDANGLVLSDLYRDYGEHGSRSVKPGTSTGESYSQLHSTRPVKQDNPYNSPVSQHDANVPCGTFVGSSKYFLEYDFRDKTVINDNACAGALIGEFRGHPAKLDYVDLTLVDLRRAYGHHKALTQAIEDAPKAGATRSDSPRPKL